MWFKKGERVAIQIPNLLQTPIAIMGTLKAGLIVVNMNPLYTSREMSQILEDSKPKALLIFTHSAHQLKTSIPHTITTDLGDLFSTPKRILFYIVTHYIKKMVKPFDLPKSISFNKALKIGNQNPLKPPAIQKEDTAFLQYTGGTTGTPKGAVLTHQNILSNVEQGKVWMSPFLKEGKEVSVVALPLYHIFALTINLFVLPFHGAYSVLITNPRDVKSFIRILQHTKKWSVFIGVNALFKRLLNQSSFKTLNFQDLKVVVGGGVAIESSVYQEWLQTTECPIAEGYGLTEASPVVCCHILSTPSPGSCGYPFPSTDVRIVDANQKELPVLQSGELQVKGPQVMKEYWNQPEETKQVLHPDGWLRTGDMAQILENGLVQILDRKKDMILVSGFNVYPNEIENVIASHPKVSQVGVLGVPDPHSSEVPKAFIVKKESSLSQEEIISFCKKHLVAYKIPKYVQFMDQLPRSNIGKVLRRKLNTH